MSSVAFVGGAYFAGGATHEGGVAVVDDRIVAVGDTEAVLAAAGTDAEIVDTSGRLVSPGFIDAHLHPIMGGREMGQCNLTEAGSQSECLEMISEYVRRNPDLAWIEGGGWTMDHFDHGTPSKELLDALIPDRPAILTSRDHHSSWVNSAALAVAGIDRTTPDPADGRIERNPDGEPLGTLHEGATALVRRLAPEPTLESFYDGLLRGQAEVIRLGVTGWQDALLGTPVAGLDHIDAYAQALERGTLLAQVTGAIWWDRHRGLEQIGDILVRSQKVSASRGDRFRADAVKIAVDGIAESFTGAFSEPYLDGHGHPTDNSGMSFIPPQQLKEIVALVDSHGLQAHFHVIGDRAVTEALDAVEHARAANPNSTARHHLSHLQVVLSGDIPRFSQLGAIANIQALWARHEAAMDDLTLPFLDERFHARTYPFADLVASGARIAAGSDWPVSSANPLEAIHVAVTRVAEHSPKDAKVFLPEQRVTLGDAWTAYTAGSAYVNGRENEAGALKPGYQADIVVLDRDPFVGDPYEIAETGVVSTWISGRRRYEAEEG